MNITELQSIVRAVDYDLASISVGDTWVGAMGMAQRRYVVDTPEYDMYIAALVGAMDFDSFTCDNDFKILTPIVYMQLITAI